MRKFRVLLSYPPTKASPGRRRATFIGELEVGKDGGPDANVDAYGDMIELLKKLNKGKGVALERSSKSFNTINLTNGVIIYLDSDPAESLEVWLKRAIEFTLV